MSNWSIEDSLNEYQVHRWSDQYFSVNQDGEMVALPQKNPNLSSLSLKKIVDEALGQGIKFPMVLRFQDILRSQVREMNETFNATIKAANYQAGYRGVYPIKVNQLREVVEEVISSGEEYQYGLEAGSKAELLTILAYHNDPNALMILNGYKDRDYLRLGMLGTRLDKKIMIVIEKFSEIELIIDVIKETGVVPMLGVRAKLSSRGAGKWETSIGEKAKFGLSIPEILKLVERLKSEDLLSSLKLFHFHAGSQIPDIRNIKECLIEASRIYCELRKLEAPIEYFDVGGGIGVNYDGSRSNTTSSTNYTLKDYVGDVVYILRDTCLENNVEQPNIVNEAGRFITAHHSCVITNVFDQIHTLKSCDIDLTPHEGDHLLTKNMKELKSDLSSQNFQDVYNDASIIKEEAQSAFKLGVIGLKERSIIEEIYWALCCDIREVTRDLKYVPHEIRKIDQQLCAKYLCNFSVFQSTPDSWAISQILPIVPLTRLNEEPTVQGTLCDITCDSDGAVSKFLGPNGEQKTLLLHPLNSKEDYTIGIFMTGAYQDVMGDMHNLFGRLNEVHVYADDSSEEFYIEEVIQGQRCSDVLEIMQYNPKEMCRMLKTQVDKQVRLGKLRPRLGVELTDFYEKNMLGYTYLS